ncbi:F0F1 ATP synthase subunit B [Inquilinus sp. Marseille-Q2685]|uniref:F0F1 ATP synthase subunit B family protein n=1 Tax=Inquilinus sp. Marseille-Q2685 TaxID=2866581 RepID=UPI001CE3EAB5|nr:F0F1 ATP synthase subunit B [Inquilinus sp. Marseille-Q2685]
MSVLDTIANEVFIGAAHAQDAVQTEAAHTEANLEHVEHAEADSHGAVEWVLAAALIVLIVLLAIKARGAILGVLDKRTEKIREDLAEAERLRSEAEGHLAQAQARQREAAAEAAAIIERAKHDAQRHREKAAVDIEEAMKRREAMALERIAQAEAQALAEVRSTAVNVAVSAARELVGRQIASDPAKGSALIDEAIADLGGKLH